MPLRALVIDDSAYNRVTISRMLASSPDIEVVATAVNGEDGIRQAMRHRPDVITMDMMLPTMSGLVATEHIMADYPTPISNNAASFNDGKVYSVGLKAGDDGTPGWLFTNGVTPLQLQDSGDDTAGCGTRMTLGFGFSPCPNDTFAFDALVHGRIEAPFTVADWTTGAKK